MDCKYFLAFTPLIVSFDAQKFLILIQSNSLTFSFITCDFSVISKKLMPNTMPWKLSSNNFIILALTFIYFCKDFIYFIFREGEEREKGRETSMCGCLSRAPNQGPGLQPRHVPWLGIEPMTLWFAGVCSIHWATPARTALTFRLLIHFELIFEYGVK